MIGVINYGIGNVQSLVRACGFSGLDVVVVSKPSEISKFSQIVLPGVGNFDVAINKLKASGFGEVIQSFVTNLNNKVLGICVGGQVLGHSSEEGKAIGLNLLPMRSVRLDCRMRPVPHMGWSETKWAADDIFGFACKPQRYYYSHSFVFQPSSSAKVIATFAYDGSWPAAVTRGNIMAVQFHPEKSQRYGTEFLRWFTAWRT